MSAGETDYSLETASMLDNLMPWYHAYKEALHNRGLPTAIEARASGIPVEKWCEMVKDVEVPKL